MKLLLVFMLASLLQLGGLTPSAAQARRELLRSVNAPGVVPVQDSLFMDEAEVANIHWLEYLHALKKDSSEAFYQSQQPDTIRLRRWLYARHDTLNANPYYYYGYRDFYYFPVVGISYEQAVNYCRWRTATVQRGYLQSAEFKKKHKKLLAQYEVRVTYRLPTIAEWEAAAAGGLDPIKAPFGVLRPPTPGTARYKHQLLRKSNDFDKCLPRIAGAQPADEPIFKMEFTLLEKAYVGRTMAPFRCNSQQATDLFNGRYGGGAFPQYLYAHPPNGFGLFNMIGNAAELTATPGVAKGGSFEHSVLEFTLKTGFPYDGPREWLGFRCACVVELRRKAPVK
ncbi:SUMF1/EgtB/PvdO family nonheme iron enzyme [Hymenobacter ruricola]|uniref:SUMF1/EgtB/PvdO family nonheme iron enzyme n=1 Tax=Hymenobacter ruricola TaxID=2791023 RepID=A0ABS0I2B8_9BACT|nr:SUMF1/EgtB/PvdO family nonheme iron enzyme [Hymenobacter ruricola]MBF9220911.1 SUMF1/EgtB/PvdO family nonheme iron enzyme [Hymenobacter ruricola]